MANGDCTVGAQLREQNVAQGADIMEIKGRLAQLEKCVQDLTVTTSGLAWKVGAVIAVLLMAFDVLVRPAALTMLHGGG